jgi:AbiV family abortive infection protein
MTQDDLIKFNRFRELCLANAEDAIKTAEGLQSKSVNHIAFQLVVFCLEEVGKIFVGWYQINAKEKWGKEHYHIPMDDHIKKLFWAIWGPSFTNEKFTTEQMNEIKNMATKLHNRRLDVMYTELSDTVPSSAKISNEELEIYLKMGRARLEMAKLEGEVDTDFSEEKQEDIKWFMMASDHPEKRKFIFGHTSQEKLIEIGNVKDWILWLKEHFAKEQTELQEILKKELETPPKKVTEKFEPKWKITIKINTKSHSIRQNILDKFSAKSPIIKFRKGADNHTLLIDIILDKSTPIKELWHHGWTTSNLLVAALNVSTRGLFYWNIPRDVDKFYEEIWDLESKKPLEAKLQTSLELDWSSRQLYFSEEEIAMTFLVFRYLSGALASRNIEPIHHYLTALGMLAKNDMHLRLEPQCYLNFFLSFKRAIQLNENIEQTPSIKDVGFKLIGNLLKTRDEYDKVIDIGSALEANNGQITTAFTLTEIVGMKQYTELYLLTLAVREMYGDKAIILTENNSPSDDKGSC